MKNEKLTRKEIIDNRLKQASWNVTDRSQVIEEFDIHLTAGGKFETLKDTIIEEIGELPLSINIVAR